VTYTTSTSSMACGGGGGIEGRVEVSGPPCNPYPLSEYKWFSPPCFRPHRKFDTLFQTCPGAWVYVDVWEGLQISKRTSEGKKNQTQFQFRSHKLYPILDQNAQNLDPISDQTARKPYPSTDRT